MHRVHHMLHPSRPGRRGVNEVQELKVRECMVSQREIGVAFPKIGNRFWEAKANNCPLKLPLEFLFVLEMKERGGKYDVG